MLGAPGALRSALEVGGRHVVGREDARLGARLDREVRHGEPLVDRERPGAVADELEHVVGSASHANLGNDGQDQILAAHEPLLLARELDTDRRGHALPELADRQAGRDVG